MSTMPLTNALYADIAQGRRVWTDSSGRVLAEPAHTIIRGDQAFTVTLLDGGAAATMTGKTAANFGLVLKDPAALNGATLLASSGASGGSVTLLANVLTITMPTNTVAMNAWLAAEESKAARLELVNVSGGVEVGGPLASADVTIRADANRGTEDTPVSSGNGLLAAIAALASVTAGTFIEVTSTAGAVALRTITTFGKTLVACSDAAAGRTALGLGTIATAAAAAYALIAHGHSGTTDGSKLAQANTHETPDTDAASGSLHHTVGTGATQAAAGNHAHGGVYEPANSNIQSHIGNTSNPHGVTAAQAGAPALSLISAAGVRFRGTAAGAVEGVLPTAALANLTGAAAPALKDGQVMTGTVTGIVSGITPTGLEDGEGCVLKLANASLYAITISPMVEAWTGATSDRAAANTLWTVFRSGATYYASSKSMA